MGKKISANLGFICLVLLCLTLSCGAEYCQAYFNPFSGFYSNSFYCTSYCCGSCYSRYCCRITSYRLNQYACRERCLSYTDEYNVTQSIQECSKRGQFCCGTCENRSCCFDTSNYLYQDSCTNNIQEKTKIFVTYTIILIVCFLTCGLMAILSVICVCLYNKKRQRRINSRDVHPSYPMQPFAYSNGQQILYPNNLPNQASPPYPGPGQSTNNNFNNDDFLPPYSESYKK